MEAHEIGNLARMQQETVAQENAARHLAGMLLQLLVVIYPEEPPTLSTGRLKWFRDERGNPRTLSWLTERGIYNFNLHGPAEWTLEDFRELLDAGLLERARQDFARRRQTAQTVADSVSEIADELGHWQDRGGGPDSVKAG